MHQRHQCLDTTEAKKHALIHDAFLDLRHYIYSTFTHNREIIYDLKINNQYIYIMLSMLPLIRIK